MRWVLGFLLSTSMAVAAVTAAGLARDLREVSLDSGECYRVRDLALTKDEARLFFTDGYLIFAKPVDGVRTAAVFAADNESGDGEVLVLPPNRGERRSLATYTGSPNLDEHFSAAALIFSDDTYARLLEHIHENPANHQSGEMGALMADKWTSVIRNLSSSFQTRLVYDLLSDESQRRGFLAVSFSSPKLGNFDFYYDRASREQILLGKLNTRDNVLYFDVWTSFVARSFRTQTVEPEFRVEDFRIEATLERDLNLRVVTRLKAKAVRSPLPVLSFDIAPAMKISAATVDGKPAEVFRRDSMRSELVRNAGNERVVVVPPEPLVPGREYELEFQHEGKVIQDAGNQVYYVAARANWFPNKELQFAKYDLTFRYPKDLDLVTPGELVDDHVDGDWRVTRRRTSAPIRMAGFNLGRYRRERISRGGYTVEVCANRAVEPSLEQRQAAAAAPPSLLHPGGPRMAPPAPEPLPDPVVRLRDLATEIVAALEFMAARFGPPALPYLTVSPVPGGFGQGFPGLIYLSTMTYLSPQEKAIRTLDSHVRLFVTDLLQIHETAHQWWGNIVTSAGYHDEWLMEALADYSALLYLEYRDGPEPVNEALERYRSELLKKTSGDETVESSGPIVLGVRLENSQTPAAYRAITYGKGSWIMHMLRCRMGDARFLAMLLALRKEYEQRPLSTEEFRLLASQFLPPRSPDPDLENFFDQWVYGTGIPSLKLSYTVKGKAPAVHVTGTVTQSGVDADFSVAVPIEMQLGGGKKVTHWVTTVTGTQPFTVTLKQAPSKVLLDPAFTVLRK